MTTTTTPGTDTTTATEASTPGDMPAAVAVRDLSHAYAPVKEPRRKRKHAGPEPERAALHGVSLDVQLGEVFGLLGPNGSGKSTLFRILATVQQATPPAGVSHGSASIFGIDVQQDPAAARRQIGVVFQNPSLDDKLTALENLRYHGMLHGLTGSVLLQKCNAMLELVDLADRAAERVERFSGGMRRRVEIAKALLPGPRLLLLDEASTGLDPAAQQALWQTLRKQVAQTGLTVLMTTHLMHEADHCDRLAVLTQGNLIAMDTPAGLVDRVGGQVLEVTFADPADDNARGQAQRVVELLGVGMDDPAVTLVNGELRVEMADAAAAVPKVASELGQAVRSIRVARPTLEDAYLKLTGTRL